ncbi:hypothetical protein H0A64_04270 [Alcaligenaceae bacterium]|nr:hypothetical protein [Alcaligenaceae bacterium]
MPRPALYVLAGVNGAGKSSIGGYHLTQAGLAWFNPDTFARALVLENQYSQQDANAQAWQESVRRLDEAIQNLRSFAFETTLGGLTIAHKLAAATQTHDVMIWYCGLRSPEQHIARVKLRVTQGGHDIPETKIRERWNSSVQNLIALMPRLAHLRVYDNSLQVDTGAAIPDPLLLLELAQGRRRFPATIQEAANTPDWAKPILEAAFTLNSPRDLSV